MAKTTMNLTINSATYNAVPLELAKALEAMLAPYKAKAETKTETAKPAKPAKQTKTAEKKQFDKIYTVAEDGKAVSIGSEGQFIPTKVFKGVTYSLKQAGAKWDAGNKRWQFETKKACTEWCKAQDAR